MTSKAVKRKAGSPIPTDEDHKATTAQRISDRSSSSSSSSSTVAMTDVEDARMEVAVLERSVSNIPRSPFSASVRAIFYSLHDDVYLNSSGVGFMASMMHALIDRLAHTLQCLVSGQLKVPVLIASLLPVDIKEEEKLAVQNLTNPSAAFSSSASSSTSTATTTTAVNWDASGVIATILVMLE